MSAPAHRALLDEGWQLLDDGTFVSHIGSVYTRTAEGCEELGILTLPVHRNLSGNVHGGILMALFDRAMGRHARGLHPGERFATGTMTVDFLRQVRVGDFIRIRPIAVKDGRRAVFMRGEAHVGERIVGAASATFLAIH